MPTLHLQTLINARRARVFDLARSIDAHLESAEQTREQAIAGRTSGLIELGETVRWRARHFGVWLELEVKITEMDAPRSFVDVMIDGNFAAMSHRHVFEEVAPHVTLMRDEFTFRSPFGVLGRAVDFLVLGAYLRRFLEKRNRALRILAEDSR